MQCLWLESQAAPDPHHHTMSSYSETNERYEEEKQQPQQQTQQQQPGRQVGQQLKEEVFMQSGLAPLDSPSLDEEVVSMAPAGSESLQQPSPEQLQGQEVGHVVTQQDGAEDEVFEAAVSPAARSSHVFAISLAQLHGSDGASGHHHGMVVPQGHLVDDGPGTDCLQDLFDVLYSNPDDPSCPGGKRLHLRMLPKSFFDLPSTDHQLRPHLHQHQHQHQRQQQQLQLQQQQQQQQQHQLQNHYSNGSSLQTSERKVSMSGNILNHSGSISSLHNQRQQPRRQQQQNQYQHPNSHQHQHQHQYQQHHQHHQQQQQGSQQHHHRYSSLSDERQGSIGNSMVSPMLQHRNIASPPPTMDFLMRRHSLPAQPTMGSPWSRNMLGGTAQPAMARPGGTPVPMMRRWRPNTGNMTSPPEHAASMTIPEHHSTHHHSSDMYDRGSGSFDASPHTPVSSTGGESELFAPPRMINPFTGGNDLQKPHLGNTSSFDDDGYSTGSRRPSATRDDIVGVLPAQFNKRRRRDGRAFSVDHGMVGLVGMAGMNNHLKPMHLPGSMLGRRLSMPLDDGMDEEETERAVNLAMEEVLMDTDLSNLFGVMSQ